MSKKHKKIGLPPGSVVFTGSRKVEKIGIHYLQYDFDHFKESVLDNHTEITFHQSKEDSIDWYDIRGLHDSNLIETIGKTFQIHPLIQEDIVDINQRPKFEEYENGLFIIIRALAFDKPKVEISTEQVAVYFCKGLLFSFQETQSDLFKSARQRIQSGKGRIRQRGTDYLAYALMDEVVDHYFFVLDQVEQVIEQLEEDLLSKAESNIKDRIHHLKKELFIARKSIAPLREAISKFSKTENEIIDESSSVFLRDLHDHTIQVMDMVENYRDILHGLHDLHLSEISFRMNQVMKVLTIITTIFVPLSFLAGLYGMNFNNMPELQYKNGYFILLGVMVLILVGLLIWFRNKKWL